ncbi:LOW QUALITY PROTEIN: E3 ubiquitin-protein ligase SHPRH-like [Amphiura filiformis]|uniref:LOW QUALITY PROTEIN: E3 ubiquitin-protein ligase SHPRH-like n=1 Tax=Amphiura filiformis TaxID=82378 RepID=UPI003B217A99
MPRQKRKAHQLDADKRQCLTWNMLDAAQQVDIPSTSSQHNADVLPGDNTNEEIIVDDTPMCIQQTIEIKDIPQGALTHPSDNSHPIIEDPTNLPSQHISHTEYKTIWDSANYSIEVHDRIPPEELVCHLGEIKFSLSEYRSFKNEETDKKISDMALPRFLPEGRFSLFVGASTDTTFIIFDVVDGNQENILCGYNSRATSYVCLRGSYIPTNHPSQFDALEHLCRVKKGKVIKLLLKDYKRNDASLTMSVCLLQGALFTPKFAAESNIGRSPQVLSMMKLMTWMKGFTLPDLLYLKPRQQDFNQLFDCLREAHRPWYESQEVWDFQHPALIPKLRPYQSQAVKWMTEKENYCIDGDKAKDDQQESKLHILWHKVSGNGEDAVYYNSQSGQFTNHKFIGTPRIPGGILADEMGLGKTVEVLACILAHPRPGFSQEHLEETKTVKSESEEMEQNGSSDGRTKVNEQNTSDISDGNVSKDADIRDGNVSKDANTKDDNVSKDVDTNYAGATNNITSYEKPLHDQNVNGNTDKTQSDLLLGAKHDSQSAEANQKQFSEHISLQEDREPASNFLMINQRVLKTNPINNSQVNCQQLMSQLKRLCQNLPVLISVNSQMWKLHRMLFKAICSSSARTESSSIDVSSSLEIGRPSESQEPNPRLEDSITPSGQRDANEGAMEEITQSDQRDTSEGAMEASLDNLPHLQSSDNAQAVDAGNVDLTDLVSGDKADKKTDQSVPVDGFPNTDGDNLKMELSNDTDTLSEADSDATIEYYDGGDVENPSSDSKDVKVKEEPSPLICVSKGQFQCICGMQEVWVDSTKCVKCIKCNVWQHMKCVNFDLGHGDITVYLCPHCCIALKPVSSKATLIVSPTAICHQWVDEINRHINNASLRVLVYRGVKKHGFLQPRALANHDIVITTYDTLRQEINYVDLPHTNSDTGRRLRHAKRYMAVPSPLPAVDWWRICLDEAQMVECPTAKVAEMALRLTGVNRWCVTGTPIQRDLDDLYGLFLFLGVEPYWVKKWWDQMLYKPYCRGNQKPMKQVLADVLWRSAKKDVIQQIDIPPQTEQVHWLKFSPVEAHFYKRKHEDCTQDFSHVVNRLHMESNVKLNKLDKVSARKLLFPLLRLRQACCHPQAVRGEFLAMQKNTMTMAELLKSLTTKTKMECEEAHRQLVCALNGQAAVHLMKDEIVEAVTKYREVLLSAEEQKDKLKTDSLQRLHAMHNLWELLQTKPEGVAPTTRDDQLQPQMREIRDAYMAKADAFVASTLKTLDPIHRKMTEINSQYDEDCPWWLDGLVWAMGQGYDEELCLRVKNELSSGAGSDDFLNFCNRFRDVRGLQFVLSQQLDEMKESRDTVCNKLEELNVPIDQATLAKCIDCHLRPLQGKKKNNCEYCKLDRQLVEYEMRLFSFKERDLIDMDHTNQDDVQYGLNRPRGTWAASQTERALRVVQVFMRQVGGDSLMLEYSNVHMQLLEQQKKEFKCLRAVYVALRDRVAALDELEMATMRLRLRGPDEEIDKASQPYIIEPYELDQQRQKLLNDQVVAKHEMRRKLGQLVYLENLAKSEDQDGGQNPEPCPICARDLGSSWSVLTCGHCYCKDCIEVLIKRHMFGRFRCPICRTPTAMKEVSYVSTVTQEQGESDSSEIKLKGSHSTKVEAIVKALIQIRLEDPTAKALVFSTWVDVLDIIGRALRENKVEYRSISQPGHRLFQSNLMDFKQEPGITALLIPVHTGSHGLNLIEATHVLLVEPILNPASELQAVGRVHRIGQSRPTVVHRFLVHDTIEERLQALLSANPMSTSMDSAVESDTGNLTLADLQQLFSQTNYHYSSGSDHEET